MGSESESLVGQTIGNYEVHSLLGEGAMGQVYLGQHPRIGRKVAIKVLQAHLSATPAICHRFISEAKAVNLINHPNIVQIFDFGDLADGRLYFTMEYLEGCELSKYLEERAPLTLGDTAGLVDQISDALEAAHRAGIIHRDLKPDNVFLSDTPRGRQVKVLDFGIAKLRQTEVAPQFRTSTGVIMGTPLYMAPEQAAGQTQNITARSDIYSLGVIVYEMLSGQVPHSSPTTAELLYRRISEPPQPLEQCSPRIPKSVREVVHRSLATDPNNRQTSAGQLRSEFEQAFDGAVYSEEAMAATQLPAQSMAATALATAPIDAQHADVPPAEVAPNADRAPDSNHAISATQMPTTAYSSPENQPMNTSTLGGAAAEVHSARQLPTHSRLPGKIKDWFFPATGAVKRYTLAAAAVVLVVANVIVVLLIVNRPDAPGAANNLSSANSDNRAVVKVAPPSDGGIPSRPRAHVERRPSETAFAKATSELLAECSSPNKATSLFSKANRRRYKPEQRAWSKAAFAALLKCSHAAPGQKLWAAYRLTQIQAQDGNCDAANRAWRRWILHGGPDKKPHLKQPKCK